MVAVYLHATTTGARIGTLSVYDNGGGSPQKVALSGTGS
jgi:hypothetical protein